jgi:transcription-repair coupling factor (superfamily II helicase)
MQDRFGEGPEPLRNLFALARMSARCRSLGIARLEVGPTAVAAMPRTASSVPPPAQLERKGERFLLRRESACPAERVAAAEALLAMLESAHREHAALRRSECSGSAPRDASRVVGRRGPLSGSPHDLLEIAR